ncbi:hypothetical protein CsatB_027192 [Cannabis sativa]|uniref:Uncharacterized protein n=2 Tax=Cannabis sativa TaxID=3483 RepID=A0A7J6EY52_CANSA|nr:uncharacterized protein LOC115723489 [Cannabis sativa]KAF4363288.1 hypothetical protein F8388_001829 [Cannabis sativa]KAF4391441.1 hypothetical protein G4B88_005512 [Cannabis sativa]
MADTNGSLLLQTHHHHADPAPLHSLLHSLDPISLILSQNSHSEQPVSLKLTTESYIMERGPRYTAYAELRESRLRMKNARPPQQELDEPEFKLTPQKKQVRFQTSSTTTTTGSRKGSSFVAQSVPDFSAVLRKENRKPSNLPPTMEMTPPGKTWSKVGSKVLTNSRGSKSANGGDKKSLMTRKSYASLEELKGLSSAASNAINGENRAIHRGGRQTVLAYRAF